jgi:hypothetical protein
MLTFPCESLCISCDLSWVSLVASLLQVFPQIPWIYFSSLVHVQHTLHISYRCTALFQNKYVLKITGFLVIQDKNNCYQCSVCQITLSRKFCSSGVCVVSFCQRFVLFPKLCVSRIPLPKWSIITLCSLKHYLDNLSLVTHCPVEYGVVFAAFWPEPCGRMHFNFSERTLETVSVRYSCCTTVTVSDPVFN